MSSAQVWQEVDTSAPVAVDGATSDEVASEAMAQDGVAVPAAPVTAAPDAHVLAAHRARLTARDPLLAPVKPLPDLLSGDRLLVVPGGVGLVRETVVDQDSFTASFTAAHESRLAARVTDLDALAALLDRWQEQESFHPGPDDVAAITWPSRDTAAAGLFIDRGFAPETVLAVRRAGFAMPDVPSGITVRRARESDLDAIVALWVEEVQWDRQFRSCVLRDSTEQRIRDDAQNIFTSDGLWAWVADAPDGAADGDGGAAGDGSSAGTGSGGLAGMMVVQPPERALWASAGLAVAPATYLTCGVVTERYRGGGVGYALVRAVHAYLDARGVAASLLHYAAANPLSVPFWSRCGYRPLTTVWARGTIGGAQRSPEPEPEPEPEAETLGA